MYFKSAVVFAAVFVISFDMLHGDDNRQDTLTKLQDESFWFDPIRKDELLEYVVKARKFRDVAFANIFARHIDYRPFNDASPIRPAERENPAYGALKELGLSAVAAILTALKTIDPEPRAGAVKHRWLVNCLLEIYEPGGESKRVVRYRLELELKSTSGPERKNLRHVIDLFKS